MSSLLTKVTFTWNYSSTASGPPSLTREGSHRATSPLLQQNQLRNQTGKHSSPLRGTDNHAIKNNLIFLEKIQKGIDKWKKKCYNSEVATISIVNRDWKISKNFKKTQKSFKKGIDKWK